MSEERVWRVLCARCNYLFAKYGNGIELPDIQYPSDPVVVFDETEVEYNVWRFVVYILWLEKCVCSFDKYQLVKAERPESWNKCLVKLATL